MHNAHSRLNRRIMHIEQQLQEACYTGEELRHALAVLWVLLTLARIPLIGSYIERFIG